MIWLPAGGAKSPPSAETIARGEHFIRMEGKETYRFATRTLATTALESRPQVRPRARRHRPVHPAPGQHPDHRGGREGPEPADGPDVHERRRVRQHVGGVRADRAGRGGQRGPRQGRRQRSCIVAFGAGLHLGRGDDRVDGRSGARARAPTTPSEPRTSTFDCPVDWDSVDPIPPALAELMARPGTVNPPLDDVVPGEPGARRRSPAARWLR